jgi:23S rRNA (adenine2503-C2)-methyltransferase
MSEPQQRELLSLSNEQLTELLDGLAQPSYRLRQLVDGLYRQKWSALHQFTTLPQSLRRQLSDSGYSVGLPHIEKKFTSSDGTVRYLFQFSDGQSVETVWMPDGDGGEAGDGSDSGDEELTKLSKDLSSQAPRLPQLRALNLGADLGSPRNLAERSASLIPDPLAAIHSKRATICVSSQVGCAVECAFCMTALLGLHRNLTAGEIVGQVLAVLNDQHIDLNRDRINLVFMGQGEPFLNYDNFMLAVRRLALDSGIPASRMTVSTSGIVPRIVDFGAEAVRPKLAVSLNASNETLRTGIMPITRKWTIEKLLAALRDFPLRNRERLTFEYVLLGGLNDDPSHARELVDLIRGLRAKVNLIALNPGPEIPFSTPDPARVAAFQSVLTVAGIPAFLRRPRGRDIYAACGQLKHTTELIQLQ